MAIDKKQMKFFFSAGIFCVMIIKMAVLPMTNCFALEQLPPFSYYEVIEQRNIFRPKDEQPVAFPEQKSVPPAPIEASISGLNNYVLTGIVRIRGAFKATITDKTSKNGHYVGITDLIDDFKVTDIRHDKVILEKNGETYELKINSPVSHGTDKDLSENINPSKETITPEEVLKENNTTVGQSNVLRSIRMGTSNVKRQQ